MKDDLIIRQEEAIVILSDMKIDIPVPKAAATQRKRNVALDMAISALKCSEIPNNSDCISRQEAIDYCCQLINVEHQQGSDEMNYGHERVNQTETILHHLEIMPSAKPESQWILCSERLPEYDAPALLSTAWGKTEIGWWTQRGWVIAPASYRELKQDAVVAWMPLPKPWEGR